MTASDSSGRGTGQKAKDDISRAPESGEKPEALEDGRGEAASSGMRGQPQGPLSGGRSTEGQAKDDVSRAPESGDKPEAR